MDKNYLSAYPRVHIIYLFTYEELNFDKPNQIEYR